MMIATPEALMTEHASPHSAPTAAALAAGGGAAGAAGGGDFAAVRFWHCHSHLYGHWHSYVKQCQYTLYPAGSCFDPS